MSPPEPGKSGLLLREVLGFQLKLALEALRDIALIPVSLVAAAIDMVMMKKQSPEYFRSMLALGRRSDDWIDLWATADTGDARPANVDALLTQIEQVVRDPRGGQRKARVLMRWAEMNLARQRRKPGAPLPAEPSEPPPPPA